MAIFICAEIGYLIQAFNAMDDNAKILRRAFRNPSDTQIKKAAGRVIEGGKDSHGRSRSSQRGYQDDVANLRTLLFKRKLAERLDDDDNEKPNDSNTMTQTKSRAVEVTETFAAAEPPDLLKEIEQAKSNAQKAKDDIDRNLQRTLDKLAKPLKDELADKLSGVCELIKQLDSEDLYDGEYLKDEGYKDSVAFLKKRFGGRNESGNSGGASAGKPKPGKKINSAIKRAKGSPVTIEQIAKDTGLTVEVVKAYLTTGDSSTRYEKSGDGFIIKAS